MIFSIALRITLLAAAKREPSADDYKFHFYQEPYRPPFCPGATLPIRPPAPGQYHIGLACAEPPDTDDRVVYYHELTTDTNIPVSLFHFQLKPGMRPNPEAVPVCAKWFSADSLVVTTETCQELCVDAATNTCKGIRQNWVYQSWISQSPTEGGGDTLPNGMIDCVINKMQENSPECMGPCAKAEYHMDAVAGIEVPCVLQIHQCTNAGDPRIAHVPTTPEPTENPSTDSKTTASDRTERADPAAGAGSKELGLIGGALVSGAGAAAICCYCSSDTATQGMHDFGAQIGDGIDDVERIARRDKCAEEMTRGEEQILKRELSIRAMRANSQS